MGSYHRMTDFIFDKFQEATMPKLKTAVLMLGTTNVNTSSVGQHGSVHYIECVYGNGLLVERG